jgi:polysaccharide pyruvyl transferase WcaK-like protein
MRRLAGLTRFLLDARRDIELFGMFDADNLGDEAMYHAGLSILPAGRVVPCLSGSRIGLLDKAILARSRSDLVIGGGTLIHGGPQKGRRSWLEYIEQRSRRGARIAVMGTGLSFKEEEIASKAEPVRRWVGVLEKAGMIGVRGPRSLSLAQGMGLDATIFGDGAFSLYDPALPRRYATRQPRERPLMGFNAGLCRNDQKAYETVCIRLLRSLRSTHDIRFYVVRPTDNDATDRIVVGCGLQSQAEIVRNYVDPYAYMRSVIDCDGMIALKLHAAGLAMVAGVPTLLFKYRPKCQDFVQPIGLEKTLLEFPLRFGDIEIRMHHFLQQPADFVATEAIAGLAAHQRAEATRHFGMPLRPAADRNVGIASV